MVANNAGEEKIETNTNGKTNDHLGNFEQMCKTESLFLLLF